MGRVAALRQLVVVMLLVLLLCARAMPRSGGAIVFRRDDRIGTVWDRIRARVSRPAVSNGETLVNRRRSQGGLQEELELTLLPPSVQQPHQHQKPWRRSQPRRSSKATELTRKMSFDRPRKADATSAIIFPGQPGYEPPKTPGEPTKRPADVATPSVGTFVVGPAENTEAPVRTPEEEGLEVPECDGVPFRALDPVSGHCRSLTMRSGCAPGEWFVLDHETRLGECRPHPCPAGFAMLDGACHNMTDRSVCAARMVPQVDEFGEASCDCERGCVFWPAERRCYPALLRGPCADGQQLTVRAGRPVCVQNPCGRDGMAQWPQTGACHLLRNVSDSPCPHGRMEVDSTSLQLVCNDAVANSVFSTPSVRCAVGSRRAQGGRCKRAISSGGSRRRFSGSRCASGYVEAPGGGCRRKFSGGFGSLG